MTAGVWLGSEAGVVSAVATCSSTVSSALGGAAGSRSHSCGRWKHRTWSCWRNNHRIPLIENVPRPPVALAFDLRFAGPNTFQNLKVSSAAPEVYKDLVHLYGKMTEEPKSVCMAHPRPQFRRRGTVPSAARAMYGQSAQPSSPLMGTSRA